MHFIARSFAVKSAAKRGMDNPKSKLSEYCNKNGLKYPIYTADSSGPPHNPEWTAYCVVAEQKYIAKGTYKTRTMAEQAAAGVALVNVSSGKMEKLTTNSDENYYYLVIDLDSQNQFNKYFSKLKSLTNSRFLGVGGPRTKIPDGPNGLDERFEFLATNSAIKNAADMELAFRLGRNLDKIPKNFQIMIFSTDNSLANLVNCVKQYGYNAHFRTSIVDWLSSPRKELF